MNDIEKCAKLIGYEKVEGSLTGMVYQDGEGHLCTFDPLTNKSDLMDLECALGICVEQFNDRIQAWRTFTFSNQYLRDHPDKFTARAHAVITVAVQIYDRRDKDGSGDK